MSEEEKWCKETLKKHFDKTLEITKSDELDFKRSDVIFAVLNTNHVMLELEIIAIPLVSIEVLHIRNAI